MADTHRRNWFDAHSVPHNNAMTSSFSIIVPTLDRRQMLRDALASIRAQRWGDVEIIVVDGGSTDGTIDDLRRELDVQLIEGPDRGLYDAINKGIARCSGEIIGILNSDDDFPPGTFAAVAAAFTPDAQAVCGTALMIADDQVVTVFDDQRAKALASPRISLIGSCVLNARFMRRNAVTRIGSFSLDHKYVSDRDWLTRWYEAGLSTVTIGDVVYRYRQHSGSLTFDADRKRELLIREDLLRLARRWRNDPAASAETRHVAMLLEGRCIAKLTASAVREHRMADAARWLCEIDGRRSPDPLISMARAGADWISHARFVAPFSAQPTRAGVA
jgi:glycosyltransferase involved in cell wall biosynthesis